MSNNFEWCQLMSIYDHLWATFAWFLQYWHLRKKSKFKYVLICHIRSKIYNFIILIWLFSTLVICLGQKMLNSLFWFVSILFRCLIQIPILFFYLLSETDVQDTIQTKMITTKADLPKFNATMLHKSCIFWMMVNWTMMWRNYWLVIHLFSFNISSTCNYCDINNEV